VVASYAGDQESVSALLQAGADPNAIDIDSASPLHKAAFNGHTEVCTMLLEKGSDIDARDGQGGR
jgi:ankyrin repeat protein